MNPIHNNVLTKQLIGLVLCYLILTPSHAEPIINMPAHQLAVKIANGEITSESTVRNYLARIEQLDRKGPKLQSIIAINPDAMRLAKERDQQIVDGIILGPLHGVPFLVKDNIETSELPTTAGSLALANNHTKRDAPIIARLKQAGAIVLGKTNLSEWANFRDNDSVSGWSGAGGQTRNPHSLDRSPCGSSSGTGAALAAQLAPLGIGTETNGSVICPSAMNGIVGFKPSVGLLSRTHIVPISVTHDTAGPMTRSVKDAALMLTIMAGSDKHDASTKLADSKKQDYVASLNMPIKKKRIGIFRAVQSEHPEIIKAFNEAVAVMQAQGVEVVDINEYETPDDFWQKSLQLLLIEFKQELNRYLSNSAPEVKTRSLEALITFNNSSPREMAIFSQSLFEEAQKTEGYNEEYQQILAFLQRSTQAEGIDKLLSIYKVDAIMMPSQVPAFLIDPLFGDSFAGGFAGAGWMAAIAGYPHVSVPMGSMKGLPINVSFMGAKYTDALMLNLAYQYEQATHKIIAPTYQRSSQGLPAFVGAMQPTKQN